jgi:hypothetical protein
VAVESISAGWTSDVAAGAELDVPGDDGEPADDQDDGRDGAVDTADGSGATAESCRVHCAHLRFDRCVLRGRW